MEKNLISNKKKAKPKKLIHIMKWCLIFIIVGIGSCFANETYSQRTFFTFEYSNRTVKEIIHEIEQSSEFIFFYLDNSVNLNRKVSVKVENEGVEKVLDQLFAGTRNKYYVSDRQIVIANAKTPEPPVPVLPLLQQGRTITGVVRDFDGPIIGANVIIKGTTNGSVTDINGQFTISNVQTNAVLQVSYIGFLPQEINTANRTQFDIIIQEDIAALEEVIVVGYGTLQKRDVTGSIGQVQYGSIERMAAQRIDQALIGQLAGVQAISTTGQPGEALNIRVRGVGSISAGSQPLYVVDGFPEANLQMLNPNDIETIDVLKDASATAIYGSRGANGVVLITTKRGKEGKSMLSLDIYYGWQKVLKIPKYLSMMDQAQYYYDGILNENLDAGRDVSGDPLTWRTPVPRTIMRTLAGEISPTDAFDYVFRTAPQQSYSLSARGGTKELQYAVSGSYMSQDGIVIPNDFKRFTVRANIDARVHPKINMKFNITSSYSFGKNAAGSGGGNSEGVLGNAIKWQYFYPLYNEDGSYLNSYPQDAMTQIWNPMASAYEIKRKQEQFRTMGNLVTDINITNDLRLNILLGVNTSNSHSYRFVPAMEHFNDTNANGNDTRSSVLNWLTEFTLHYQKSIKNHNLNAMIGYTTQQNNGGSNSLTSQDYPNNMVYTLNAASNPITQGSSEESQWSLISYLARINYNYLSKYYITGSIRADGSSRFGKERKYGYFPSVALMWRVSEENFIKDIHQFSDLKLRASYGATGNNNIGNYAHLATVAYPSYGTFGGGMAPNNIENSTLTWEKQNSINFGVDAGLFGNRIMLNVDYFITTNHQLLLNVDVPQTTGFSTSMVNIGEVRNKGWEFTINTHNLKGVFNWRTNFNISAYRNKVIKLGPEGAPLISSTHITQIRSPIGMFYGYKTDGVYMNQAEVDACALFGTGTSTQSRPGDIKFVDVDGDGRITTDDRTIIGSPHPDFYYGMTNTFSYRNFDFSFSLTGSYGNMVATSSDELLFTRARFKQYDCDIVNNWWKSADNPGNGKAPRANNVPTGGLRERSDRYLDDASFLRVNNINLSYTLPGRLAQSLYVSNLRVYVTSNNPFLFTKFRDFNPEVSTSSSSTSPGMLNFDYPVAKSVLFGLSVTF